MEDKDISFLFTHDEVYIVSDAEHGRTKVKADLLLSVSTNGEKERCAEIVNRILLSLKPLGKDISTQYDMPIIISMEQNCKQIVAMGFSGDSAGFHADFSFNRIFCFKEKYILLTENILSIDQDKAKKKQFWKLLHEILACSN